MLFDVSGFTSPNFRRAQQYNTNLLLEICSCLSKIFNFLPYPPPTFFNQRRRCSCHAVGTRAALFDVRRQGLSPTAGQTSNRLGLTDTRRALDVNRLQQIGDEQLD